MLIALAAIAALAVVTPNPTAHAEGDKVTPVRAEKLPNVPGKSLTAVVVNYVPGGKSARHHHSGSVFAYVLSGEIRSENSATGPARVYKAGESFFEPPGSEHLVSVQACLLYSSPTTARNSLLSANEPGSSELAARCQSRNALQLLECGT